MSIVLYRSPIDGVIATLKALAGQSLLPARVAIHMNAPAADDAENLCALTINVVPQLTCDVSESAENRGFSGGHNQLMKQLFDAGCSAVLVLNPDLVLEPSALAEMSAAAASLAPPVLVGPVLELADQQTLAPTGLIDTLGIRWTWDGRHLDDRQGEPLRGLPDAPAKVAGISGACLLVRRDVYDVVVRASGEFFDEDFIAYREDAELAYRGALLGVESYLVPSARGLHARRLRGTERGVRPDIDRLGVRNRFLIAFKFGRRRPGGLVGPLLRDVVVIAAVVLRERSSWPGLIDAWRLRHRMREKGHQVHSFIAERQ